MKRFLTMMLAFALLLSCGLVRAEGALDVNADVILTLECRDGSLPLPGIGFRLYRVANTDTYGNMSWTGAFVNANIPLPAQDQENWRDIESTLASYVGVYNVQPNDTGTTNQNGRLTFPTPGKTMKPGLYLILSDNTTVNDYVYTFAPQLVFLPDLVETSTPGHYTWVYDVTRVMTKYERENVPVTPPPEPPTLNLHVLKIWNDDENAAGQRPGSITVALLKNGEIEETVTLSQANNWSYTWENLEDDPMISWTVGEVVVDVYEQLVVLFDVINNTYIFTITNTIIPPPTPTPTPTATPTPEPDPSDTPAPPTEPPTPEPTDVPTNPPTNPPTPTPVPSTPAPTAPPTGQLWWPVSVMAPLGVLLVAIGLVSILRKKREDA